MPPAVSGRHHAFDALRSSMMLLGIVIHAASNYVARPIGGWPYHDAATTVFADLLVVGIHVFRMPVFFVMAGFFAGMLVDRRGIATTLQHRFLRIALPFGIFWLILSPLVAAAAVFAVGSKNGDVLTPFREWYDNGVFWKDNTLHLWFLWYLIIFYAAAAFLIPVGRLISPATRVALSSVFVRVMSTPARVIVLAIPLIVIVYLQRGILQTSLSFAPNAVVLAGYAVFFTFGWALWHHQALLDHLSRFAWTQIGIALLVMLINIAALAKLNQPGRQQAVMVAAVTGGIATWLFVFGFSGLAIRFARHERPWIRYMTDASYWMYLMHVPLVWLVAGLLANAHLPALAKFAIVVITVAAALLLTYHWLVRGTMVGALLNGRRYPARSVVTRQAEAPVLQSGD